jgi:putative endopeptidase
MTCRLFLILSAACLVVSSCSNNSQSKKESKEDILIADLDTLTKPSEDFFQYANGGWIKKNPIPAEQSSWGIGNLVFEENLARTREISEEAAKSGAAKGTNEQKIGDFWNSGIDSAKIEADGLKYLQPYLDKVNAITDIRSLVATVSELKKLGSSTLFADFVTQDDKNSEMMTYKLWQGGIGLPEREYYFKTDSATKDIRNEYVKYIAKTLYMAGDDSVAATKTANDILAMETKLAKASRKLADLRDPYANYNKMAIADLPKMSAAIDWDSFLAASGVKSIDSVIVGQPEFFKALETNLKSVPIDVWKSYVRFNLISDFAGALPDRFGIAAFNFSKLFSGAKERRPRWKRVMQSEENAMGELLGQLYVKKYFNETAKKRYVDLVEAIRDALRERIRNLTWMSDSTKQKAYAKLAAITKKVGYPDKWKDYSAMTIGKESYLQNIMNANLWRHNFNFNKLGKPVDRTEWEMTPQTWNAYYNPSNNEIVLPAGIFTVPGFRDEELDDALVYGYAGASTIGHEITHGFDDEGRQYDAKGNLVSWWTKKDEDEFKKRADVIIKQFDEYEPLPGYHINGRATTGENIADLGGILIGLDAFKKTQQYKEGKVINGLTPLQRYFLGYALSWQFHFREETQRNRLLVDVHSPAKYRVNGPMVDVDEFYEAFNIKPGDKMYRADSLRVKIW